MSETMIAARPHGVAASLRAVLRPDQIEEDPLEPFEVDGLLPAAVARPASVDDVSSVLSEATRARAAVIAFGGGTHAALGNVPQAYDVALSMAGLDRTVEHELADLTLTVQAGVPLAGVQALLARDGQFLPLDPPCGEAATIGGVLAASASGPLRHGFGTARDWLIGITVVRPDGTLSRSGGRVVKNVTGYDMGKLYVGSLGTLGVIVEATFKVAPMPKTQTTLAIACDSPYIACTIALAAHNAGVALLALELLSPPAAQAVVGEHQWTLLARAGGSAGAVERTSLELRALADGLGAGLTERETADVWGKWVGTFAPEPLAMRASVRPSDVASAVELLDRRLVGSAALLSATVTAGVIRLRLRPLRETRAAGLIERTRDVVARYAGTLIVDAAPLPAKRHIDVFGAPGPDFAIMKRLKEEFDPRRILAPGRFLGRL